MSRPLRILISLALLALVIFFADWKAVWQVLKDVQLAWVGAALLLALVDRVLMNYRWQILLAGRGIVPGFARLFKVQLAANFLGSFLPSSIGVDAVRIAALCRAGHPTAPVIAATLVDRVSIALASLLFGSAMVIVLAQSRVPDNVARFVYVMTGVGIVVCAVALHPAVRRVVRQMLMPWVPARFRETLSSVASASVAYSREWSVLGGVAVLTAAAFVVRILFAKAVAYSVGVDIPFLDLLLIIPILWILVMLPITVGGLGVQDAGYVVLMAMIGVAAPLAVSMSLVEHVVSRLASLPGVLFVGDVTKKNEAG